MKMEFAIAPALVAYISATALWLSYSNIGVGAIVLSIPWVCQDLIAR